MLFGDGLNDIEMLQFVGNSVAMGNAPDDVKKGSYACYKGRSRKWHPAWA
ncbi:hypothetical protein GCM10020331_028990 [Ectobacillus funiculus]